MRRVFKEIRYEHYAKLFKEIGYEHYAKSI